TPGTERKHVVPSVDDRNRHRLLLAAVLGEVSSPMLRRDEQLPEPARSEDLAAIEADIGLTGLRVLSDDAAERVHEAATVEVVPFRHGKLEQIDLLAVQHVFLDWAGAHDGWRDAAAIDVFQTPDDLSLRAARREPEQQADLCAIAESRGKELGAP